MQHTTNWATPLIQSHKIKKFYQNWTDYKQGKGEIRLHFSDFLSHLSLLSSPARIKLRHRWVKEDRKYHKQQQNPCCGFLSNHVFLTVWKFRGVNNREPSLALYSCVTKDKGRTTVGSKTEVERKVSVASWLDGNSWNWPITIQIIKS